MQSQEGGIVPEEYRVEYVVDRVNTLRPRLARPDRRVRRCHDHKYDPITQKEFYRLFGFFNNVNETGQIPYSGVPSPTVMVDDADVERSSRRCASGSRALEAETRSADVPRFDAGFARWLATAADAARASVATPPGLIAHFPFETGSAASSTPKPDRQAGAPKREARSRS